MSFRLEQPGRASTRLGRDDYTVQWRAYYKTDAK